MHNTHATELVRAKWDIAHIQKRLGHADVQTTINTYIHLDDDDLRTAYNNYLKEKQRD